MYTPEDKWVAEVQLHIFLTSALNGLEWSDLGQERLTPRKKTPRNTAKRKLVGSRAGHDVSVKKISCPCWGPNPVSSSPQSSYYTDKAVSRLSGHNVHLYLRFGHQVSVNSEHHISSAFIHVNTPVFLYCKLLSSCFTHSLHKVYHKKSAIIRENIPEVNCHRYNQTCLKPKLNGYRDD